VLEAVVAVPGARVAATIALALGGGPVGELGRGRVEFGAELALARAATWPGTSTRPCSASAALSRDDLAERASARVEPMSKRAPVIGRGTGGPERVIERRAGGKAAPAIERGARGVQPVIERRVRGRRSSAAGPAASW
jgi:hypothetical protein